MWWKCLRKVKGHVNEFNFDPIGEDFASQNSLEMKSLHSSELGVEDSAEIKVQREI